ncbi:MAG: anti-sigma factor family protein [Pirellulaceae bacterium]
MNHQEPTLPEIDPVEEELVAYLDEELEPEHRARVEHRLAADARYRDKLKHMQKSWDMLDVLARSEPDEGFTRTTVAMVALKAKEATQVQKESTQRFSLLFRLAVAVGTLACGLIAYSVGSWLLSAPDRQLVQDLTVIEHLDEYNHAESVAFLRSLEDLFGQHYRQAAADAESMAFLRSLEGNGLFVPEAAEDANSVATARKQETAEQRRERLEKMTPEQKGAILERKQRFESKDLEDQDRLRKLAAEIAADPQGDKLEQVLTNYHEWLKSLGAKDQSEVLSAPADERIVKIKEVQNRQAAQRLKAVALELSSQDLNAISDWLDIYVAGHLTEFNQLTPPQFKAALDKLPAKDRISRHVRGIFWRLGRKELLPEPTDQELDALVSVLSTKAQVVLEEAESHEQKWQYAQELIHQVQQSKRYPRLSDEELRKFAATLKPEQREALENKTADEMKNALRDLYYRQKASPPGGFYPWEKGAFGQPFKGEPAGGKSGRR